MERVRIDSLEVNLESAFRNPKSAILLGALLFALCPSAEAQQPGKVSRLGWLASPSVTPGFFEAFRQGLRELGYVEGKNIVIEQRRAEKADQAPFTRRRACPSQGRRYFRFRRQPTGPSCQERYHDDPYRHVQC